MSHFTFPGLVVVLTLHILTGQLIGQASAAELGVASDISANISKKRSASIVAEIGLDLNRGLSIGGSKSLRRGAYFNIHATPNEFSAEELDWLAGDLRASFGRSMGGISGFMHRLVEDPSRPGHAEPRALESNAEAVAEGIRRKETPDFVKANVVNSVHPESYFPKPDKSGFNSVFSPASHTASAEIVSAYFAAADVELAPYFEVANECNVKSKKLGTTFEDMCDLHTILARELHQKVPDLKVGGPTSAWPAFEIGDFRIWREQMGTFIDRAGKDMDFLSVHLYSTHWDDKLVNRFGANVDAILDLMENQSLLSTGEVKPLLISECGTGFRNGQRIKEEYSPHRDWLVLRGANHIFMNLLRRDDRIVKMIPFIVGKATWYQEDHPYPWVLFHRKAGQWVPTHLAKWYEFWKNVQGRHLPTTCSSLDVQTHALLNGRTMFLLVDNLADADAKLSVSSAMPAGVEVISAAISHMYYDGQQPQLDTDQPVLGDWRDLSLGPNESCIVRLELSESPELDRSLLETTHYADRTVRPIKQKPTYFQVAGTGIGANVASAKLRIGFGRKVALSKQPKVLINGRALQVPEDERGECNLQGDFHFTTKEIEVPPEALKKKNRVSVQFPEAGGHVSSVVLVVREER